MAVQPPVKATFCGIAEGMEQDKLSGVVWVFIFGVEMIVVSTPFYLVTHVSKICDEAGAGGGPAELFASQCAGGWDIHGDKVGEPAEVVGGFFGLEGDGGDFEAMGESFGDVATGDSFLIYCVEDVAGGSFFEREAVEVGGGEAMGGGPTILTLADVGDHAFFACELNDVSDEALLFGVMHLGKADDGGSDAALG